MFLSSIEFYNTPNGDVCIKEQGKPVRTLGEADRDITTHILTLIQDRYPNAYKRLMELYSKSSRNRYYYEFRVVHRFIRCNFGEYDHHDYDIDAYGKLRFEEVKCPLRGECTDECIICKPLLNTQLTEREREVFSCIVGGMQAEQISLELSISISTVNRHRENIKAKICVKTISQMVSYWHENKLDE